ncbi:MAG: TonB-dependent receptor [Thermoanaerobaculales bacterium]|jgi:hemoglobin/transferrin/lactoferrin receptor protein|nr:TonB-dependent receptor [Thermoanaerobaculales bacterium]
MNRQLLILLVVLGFAVVDVGFVAAQETETTENEEQTTDQDRVFEDQITVTAARQELLSGEVAAPVTVITSDRLEELQPEKMADLFKMIPGVEVEGDGPFRGIPVIRGLTSNRVLILVDGQRLNNARESTEFAGIQPSLVNLGEVERIEVLRGPASVQYGSDAIGGVVNIITRRPNLGADDFKIFGNVSYEYGTASESQNGTLRLGGAGRRLGFEVGASIEDVDDYVAASGAHQDERYAQYTLEDDTVPNSGVQQQAFDGSFSVLTGDQGVFKVNAEVVRTEDIGFPGFARDSGIEIYFPTFDRDKLAASWASGPMAIFDDLTVNAWYQYVDKESVRNLSVPGFAQNQYTRSEIDSIGFNTQGISTVGANHLTYGIDFYQDDLHDTALTEYPLFPWIPPSDQVVVPDSTQRGLGLYISDRISASDRLTINVGLRGDTFTFDSDENDTRYTGEPLDTSDSAISGNIGVIYALTDHVNLTGLVARGYRTPNIQERTFFGPATTGDTFILQNPDLNPESSWNYEVGFKVRYDQASGGLNLFYNDLTDFIGFEFLGEQDPITGLELARFANFEKARIWGVELDLEWIFGRWWSVFGTFAYLEGDNRTTGEPLPYIAPWKVTAGVRYQRSKWWAEADLRHLGEQDRLPPGDPDFDSGTEPFTVIDLRGGYDFAFGLGVLVSLENIFDELYNEPFNNRPEPGINLRATVRYRF